MFFSKEEEARIIEAIRIAESRTSGEIRLYIEPFCLRDHPVERAAEMFHAFDMFKTAARNGVLIYIAHASRHFAIWGDTGIHERVGFQFWDAEKQLLRARLQEEKACEGICEVIQQIGEQLQRFFPPDENNPKNELPDEIIYG